MDQKVLNFQDRKLLKKGHAGRLRRQGQIPSIIYGHQEPKPVSIDAHEFRNRFKTISESTIITLKSDAESLDVLVKDYQTDTLRGDITHIDFYEVEKGKLLRTHVPVHLKGIPLGVREGGILESLVHDIEVECLPKDLPSEITVEVEELEIGHSVHVSGLTAVEGVRFLTSQDQVICTILHKREEIEAVAEEEEEELEEGAEAEEGEEEEDTQAEE